MRAFLLFALTAFAAQAQEVITVLDMREIPLERRSTQATHELRLTLAFLDGSGWTPEAILAAARESARILGRCGVAAENIDLVRIGAPIRFHDFHTIRSRELARALAFRKPVVYFVAGTLRQPAFEAEAVGRGNSGSRPELRDTVWITRGARDLGVVLAHELAHVLMDSGSHSDEPGNLMRDETMPDNLRLTEAQCAQLRDAGSRNGLLLPLPR